MIRKLIDAQSGIANITSSTLSLEGAKGLAVQWNITGAGVAGTAKVQGSVDGVNFKDISSLAASAAGSLFDNLANINYPYIRMFWDFGTSTAATVTGIVSVNK